MDKVAVADFNGFFQEMSASWQTTLGWPLDTLLSRPIIEFVHPDDHAAVHATRQTLRAGGQIAGLRNRYMCRDGSYRWFEWKAIGDVEHQLVFAVARDITDQVDQEEQLRQSQAAREELRQRLILKDRMATVGTLARGMAHEINNPLASVMANISLLREILADAAEYLPAAMSEELDELAQESSDSAGRIAEIVARLNMFAPGSEGRREHLELAPLVQRTVRAMRPEIRRRSTLVEDYGITPPIEAEQGEFSQVVLNLLVNATQSITTGDPGSNRVEVRTYSDSQGWAALEVSDTGVGISDELLGRVFEPFVVGDFEDGVGIGLSICHAVVERMGGTISLKSERGVGTTVCVRLPPMADTEVMPEPEQD